MAGRFRANSARIDEIVARFPDTQDEARARVAGFAHTYSASADFFDEWAARVAGGPCGAPDDTLKLKE
jgi:hypothetical protein